MKIPKQFNIMGQTIYIEFNNEYCHKNECFGSYIASENKIILSDKHKPNNNRWVKYNKDIVDQVFLHELIHCIYWHLGRKDLFENEELIDSQSGLLLQVFKTSKY